MIKCTKPNCDCAEKEMQRLGTEEIKNYPCLKADTSAEQERADPSPTIKEGELTQLQYFDLPLDKRDMYYLTWSGMKAVYKPKIAAMSEGEQQEETNQLQRAAHAHISKELGVTNRDVIMYVRGSQFGANWQKKQQTKGEQAKPYDSEVTPFVCPKCGWYHDADCTPSMETKERGEQESVSDLASKFAFSELRTPDKEDYTDDELHEYDEDSYHMLVNSYIAGHEMATTTLQAEIDELKAEREKLQQELLTLKNK